MLYSRTCGLAAPCAHPCLAVRDTAGWRLQSSAHTVDLTRYVAALTFTQDRCPAGNCPDAATRVRTMWSGSTAEAQLRRSRHDQHYVSSQANYYLSLMRIKPQPHYSTRRKNFPDHCKGRARSWVAPYQHSSFSPKGRCVHPIALRLLRNRNQISQRRRHCHCSGETESGRTCSFRERLHPCEGIFISSEMCPTVKWELPSHGNASARSDSVAGSRFKKQLASSPRGMEHMHVALAVRGLLHEVVIIVASLPSVCSRKVLK